ncbi:MAG: hypothetical protein RL199_2483 [Pseudomonadota bacterium]|jgi:chromosomal replication initiator protein
MDPKEPTSYPQAGEATGAEASPGVVVESIELAAWHTAVGVLEDRMRRGSVFDRYVKSAQVLSACDGRLVLGYGSPFIAEWVREGYRQEFEAELMRASNRRIAVDFEVVAAAPELKVVPSPAPAPVVPPRKPPRPPAAIAAEPAGAGEPPAPRRLKNGLDTRYTFENYVVGGSNQFAFAACKAVSEAVGQVYNPLVLWGGVGLGKTHLMQAVAHGALAVRPGTSVLYVSSEQFTNDLVTALQTKRMGEFRKRYRECDLLLVDDIQFFAGKQATMEEFFHTFNDLHAKGRQVIVTCDRAPAAIDGLEERLRSRLQWGLLADIQPPELETRVAILQSKAATMRLPLAAEVAQFVATHVRRNVRELEGTLTRLAAFASLIKSGVTLEMCREVLRSVLLHQGKRVDAEVVMRACAEHFAVTVADMTGPSRVRHLARARQAAMFLVRQVTKASYPEIGRQFGGRDHSTVIAACDRVKELMLEDVDFRRSLEQLQERLTSL